MLKILGAGVKKLNVVQTVIFFFRHFIFFNGPPHFGNRPPYFNSAVLKNEVTGLSADSGREGGEVETKVWGKNNTLKFFNAWIIKGHQTSTLTD